MLRFFLLGLFVSIASLLSAQDATALLQKVKQKMDQVKDYVAEGVMKTDVLFIKAPVSKIKTIYQYPDRFQIRRNGGVSLLPKGGISVNLRSLVLAENYTVVDAGTLLLGKQMVRVLKLLPLAEDSDIILSTLYIDESEKVIRKSATTTRLNGTYEMEMSYGKYVQWGLPDKIVFLFNTKEYKLPKGITLEYDDGSGKNALPPNKKGKVEITYQSYQINKGAANEALK